MYTRKEHRIIYSLRAAGFLMLHGCRLVRTEPRQDKPHLNQFIFYDDSKVDYFFDKFNKEDATRDEQAVYQREDRARLQAVAR